MNIWIILMILFIVNLGWLQYPFGRSREQACCGWLLCNLVWSMQTDCSSVRSIGWTIQWQTCDSQGWRRWKWGNHFLNYFSITILIYFQYLLFRILLLHITSVSCQHSYFSRIKLRLKNFLEQMKPKSKN